MNTVRSHGVRDGTRVTIVVSDFGGGILGTGEIKRPVRAFAIGDRAVVGERALMAEEGEPQRDVRELGWLRPDTENIRWCRGWKGKAAKALLAQLALENSR
jgi:hypothetical protein